MKQETKRTLVRFLTEHAETLETMERFMVSESVKDVLRTMEHPRNILGARERLFYRIYAAIMCLAKSRNMSEFALRVREEMAVEMCNSFVRYSEEEYYPRSPRNEIDEMYSELNEILDSGAGVSASEISKIGYLLGCIEVATASQETKERSVLEPRFNHIMRKTERAVLELK